MNLPRIGSVLDGCQWKSQWERFRHENGAHEPGRMAEVPQDCDDLARGRA